MGNFQGLPKAVESIVVERLAGPLFRVGSAEMNGWRPAMEDAHVVVMRDTWGFFGVFDGHGGSQCSAFVARRLTEELNSGPPPEDDAAMKALMLRLDQEFLNRKEPSGSTGTFVLVKPPAEADGRYLLRVGNIGDSRVLLGRPDGTMVEGPGTDGGLTTDHKPDLASERARIERTGGTVQMISGVARVNGDLAVSRSFGDAPHKETGGPAQEDHPVSAEPEFTTLECDPTDFLVLVCDGISEGNFPNREVIHLVAEGLRQGGDAPDLGLIAAAVCRRALERNSTDNLSCMIVVFGGGEVSGPSKEFLAGPFVAPEHGTFRRAYGAMAERAGLTLEQAVELRYDALRRKRVAALVRRSEVVEQTQTVETTESGEVRTTSLHASVCEVHQDGSLGEMRSELATFGDGPPEGLEPGSAERARWFRTWLDKHDVEPQLDPSTMSRQQLLSMLAREPEVLAAAQAQGLVAEDAMRVVQVSTLENLRPAVEAHPALKWDERLTAICGQRGRVLQDDASDGTSQVHFPPPLQATAWLPTSALIDVEDEDAGAPKRFVRVAAEDKLRPAVEGHPALKWHDEMAHLCGQRGRVVRTDDADGTAEVTFPPPLNTNAWLPQSVLEDDGEVPFIRLARAPAADKLQPAIEAHPSLKWHPRLAEVCGKVGRVQQDDPTDGTSQVCFAPPVGITVWLPTEVLLDVEPDQEAAPDEGPDSKRQRTS